MAVAFGNMPSVVSDGSHRSTKTPPPHNGALYYCFWGLSLLPGARPPSLAQPAADTAADTAAVRVTMYRFNLLVAGGKREKLIPIPWSS